MNAGVDKLSLMIGDFRVLDAGKLSRKMPEQIGDKIVEPPLLIPSDTNPIYGKSAYMNIGLKTEQFIGVNIEPIVKGSPAFLKVTFNPSKYAYGGAELLNSPDILGDVITDVETRLLDAGIKTELMGAKLTRVDLTKQAEMGSLARDYITNCYDLLNAKYGRDIKRKKCNQDYYLLNAGRTWQLCAYDKNAEQEKEAPKPSNLLRNELRLFRAETIKKQSGARNLYEFINTDWNKTYNSFLESRVFNRWEDGKQLTIDFGEIDFKRYYQNGKLDFSRLIKAYGVEGIVNRFGSIDAFMSRFKEHFNRQTYWRYQAELKSIYADLETKQRCMIRELRTAFLQAI